MYLRFTENLPDRPLHFKYDLVQEYLQIEEIHPVGSNNEQVMNSWKTMQKSEGLLIVSCK